MVGQGSGLGVYWLVVVTLVYVVCNGSNGNSLCEVATIVRAWLSHNAAAWLFLEAALPCDMAMRGGSECVGYGLGRQQQREAW